MNTLDPLQTAIAQGITVDGLMEAAHHDCSNIATAFAVLLDGAGIPPAVVVNVKKNWQLRWGVDTNFLGNAIAVQIPLDWGKPLQAVVLKNGKMTENVFCEEQLEALNFIKKHLGLDLP